MKTIEIVRCPNCGSCAERHHLSSDQLIRTQCPTCDYLMITCASTGKVIEAYAPGIYPSAVKLLKSKADSALDSKRFQSLSSAVKLGKDQCQSLTSKHSSYVALPKGVNKGHLE